ncbi:hypothetical protein B0H10DRAFT_904986 [Mycena sp. CBHHK59/15]|nr:hypothetical protein B0H10DRAFT_904986 [Mycena sp. CBHHK59/15]
MRCYRPCQGPTPFVVDRASLRVLEWRTPCDAAFVSPRTIRSYRDWRPGSNSKAPAAQRGHSMAWRFRNTGYSVDHDRIPRRRRIDCQRSGYHFLEGAAAPHFLHDARNSSQLRARSSTFVLRECVGAIRHLVFSLDFFDFIRRSVILDVEQQTTMYRHARPQSAKYCVRGEISTQEDEHDDVQREKEGQTLRTGDEASGPRRLRSRGANVSFTTSTSDTAPSAAKRKSTLTAAAPAPKPKRRKAGDPLAGCAIELVPGDKTTAVSPREYAQKEPDEFAAQYPQYVKFL